MERKILTSIFKVYIKLCWRGSTSPDLLQVIWLRHTCWWQHCSSSWAGSRSWPPRTHGGWFGHRAPRRCGWPPSSWHQNRLVRWTCSSVCGPAGYTLPNLPAPLTIKNFVHVPAILFIQHLCQKSDTFNLRQNSMKIEVSFYVFTLNFTQQLYI